MNKTAKKRVLLDSSSAILLEKSGLLDELLTAYQVIVSKAVYLELTENAHPNAVLFQTRLLEPTIEIREVKNHRVMGQMLKELSVMGAGERETILQQLQGVGDFIMLDDGKGARFCLKYDLPFINALIFPSILYLGGRLSSNQCATMMETIKQLGRYSQQVVEKAESLSGNILEAFLP